MNTRVNRVLLVGDDEAVFLHVRELLAAIDGATFDLTWASSWDDGLSRLTSDPVDLALIGEWVRGRRGLDLIEAVTSSSADVPMILLTDDTRASGHDALEAGAVDYLVRRGLSPALLARAARYAIGQSHASRAQRASEARFRAMYDHSTDIIMVTDSSGRVLHINRAIESIAGIRQQDVIGTLTIDRVHPEDVSSVVDTLSTLTTQPGATVTVRYRFRHADQTWRWFEATITNLLDDPAIGGFFSTVRDATASIAAEVRLLEQAERLRLLAEMSAAFSAAALDLDSILETLARRVSEMLDDICILRLVSDDGLMLVPAAVWHPDPDIRTALQHAQIRPHEVDEWLPGLVMRTGEALLIPAFDSDEERRRRPEKESFFRAHDLHSMLIVPLRIRGEIIGTLAVSRMAPDQAYTDVDRDFLQNLADRAAQAVDNARLHRLAIEAEAQHRQLIEQLPAIIFVEALDDANAHGIGTTLYISPQVEAIFGITPDEWHRRSNPWMDIVHPDDRAATVAEIARTNETGEPFRCAYRAVRPDGRIVWVESEARLVRDKDGIPRFWQGIITDITQRKEVALALHEAEDKFRTLVEHIPAATFTIGLDGRYLYMSPQIERLLGYSAECWDAGADFWRSILHPDDLAAVVAEDARTDETGEPFDLEYRYIAADGRVVWVRNQTELLRGSDGEPRFWQGYLIDITERKRAEQKLRTAEDQYRTLVEHSPAVIFTSDIDLDSTPLYMSPQIEQMLGYPPDAWTSGEFWDQIIHPEDHARVTALDEVTGRTFEPFDIEFRVFASDGRLVWVRNYSVAICDANGTPQYWQGYLIDITAQKQAEEAIRLQAQLLEAVGQAVVATDTNRRITYWNHAAELLYGLTEAETLGHDLLDVTTPPVTRDQAVDIMQRLTVGETWEGELLQQRSDGRHFPAHVTNSPVINDSGAVIGMIGVSVDISERKQLEQQLLHQAFHDALTGLPNRNLFLDRTRHALKRSRRVDQVVAVLFLDLDNFKIVNDSLGHDIGDQLLVAIGERILACLREGDTAARLGGDEFAILLEHLATCQDAAGVASRLLDELRRPIYLDGHEMFVTPSIGIALSTSSNDLAENLLRDADVAMYTAKRNGRARYEIFEPEMGTIARERLELEHDLRRALERNQLSLHYQPVVNLCDGSLSGFEALLRWDHPSRGMVAPDAFVPVAEETGLIVPVGSWALHEACRQLRAWQDSWPRAHAISVSVNLSGRQFKELGLADEVARVLRETGLPPRCLNLEITETIMMADEAGTSAVLRELEQLGVTLAIDDFGTGYSSLGTLRHFPVETLKIDRSFVDGLGAETDDSIIVSGVVGLAHGLGLRVVAEGVETADQLARLFELGCDLGQGYYFARPLPADEVTGFLAGIGNRESEVVAAHGSMTSSSRTRFLNRDIRVPVPERSVADDGVA